MVQINEIEPARFRAGDLITIRGFGFSPTFGQNAVAVAGIPEPIFSESDTEIQVFVPAGIPVDQYVSVYVFRSDTLDNDSVQAFAMADVDDLRSGASTPPGQVPGTAERADPSRVEDVPQAQDYERMVTAMDHLLRDVLTTKGDVFASDGTGLTRFPVGATPGHRLGAEPANAEGLEYAALVRSMNYSWGGRRAAANLALLNLVANGRGFTTSTVLGEHRAGFNGTAYRLVVFHGNGIAGDTIDRVTLEIAGALVYDSGAALGVPPKGVHVANFSLPFVSGDSLEVAIQKAGTNGDSTFTAELGVR